ncbi:MAG: glycoside hydrolase family 99-like domain-containing protein, partial [Clostridia bacterium]|nr:glycoside hydrolase family 99-like domain-containing protein [Clostridia bacterium]
NEWWGKGYTEWVATKQAKPLFKNHEQPKIPLNNNFYDLSIEENIIFQSKLAKRYSIDGFVIYQYYSCNESKYGKKVGERGRLLLEKPTELYLKSQKIEEPFCLYWANHDWRKTWFGQDKQIVWPQEYGDEKDWKDFFNYNLQYFKDERYIKIDNKPVFFVFASWHFKSIELFINLWNQLAKGNGFNGIYFVKTVDARTNESLSLFNAVYRREPFYTFSKGNSFFKLGIRFLKIRLSRIVNNLLLAKSKKKLFAYKMDYKTYWKKLNDKEIDSRTIPGAVFEWDNTPRKGYNGQMLSDFSVVDFEDGYSKLYRRACENNAPFIVFNAWNEWAEGAFMEPSEKYKYSCLEIIRKIKEGYKE